MRLTPCWFFDFIGGAIRPRVCRPLPAGGRTKGTGGKDGLDSSLHERARPACVADCATSRARSAATRHRYAAGPAAAPAFPGQSFALSRLSRRRGWGELYGQPFEHRPAPIVDAGRARLRAIGERLQQIGQLGVAVLFHEARHIVGPAAAAQLAEDRKRGVTKVGPDERTRSCEASVTPSQNPGSSTPASCGSSRSDRGCSALRHDLQAQLAGRGDTIALGASGLLAGIASRHMM